MKKSSAAAKPPAALSPEAGSAPAASPSEGAPIDELKALLAKAEEALGGAEPLFERAVAKQVFPVRHQATGRTINFTMPTEDGGAFHCFTGRGEFIATLAELPKE